MATIIDPPKGVTYRAPSLQIPVTKMHLTNFKMMMVKTAVTNILNEAPVADKIYSYNRKNYARPQFRRLPEPEDEGKRIPGQQGFSFTKDKDGQLHLNVILEAFHPQQNVIPLDFREIVITFSYQGSNGVVELPLKIVQVKPVAKPNVLKHIYANAVVKEGDKEAIYEALTSPDKNSKLSLTTEIWWQKPSGGAKKAPPARVIRDARTAPRARRARPARTPATTKIAEACTSFNRKTLKVSGNAVYAGAVKLMSFRNPQDALKALRVLRHYKMDRKCSVGGNQFPYFLSGKSAPTGKINGEDCIPFKPANLKVIQAQGRWKIADGNHWMFDFNKNKTNADKALAIIKKYGFDATCYVGRPKPGMVYLKRTRAPMLTAMPIMHLETVFIPDLLRPKATTSASSQTKPQKVDLNSDIILLFDREDATVFHGFFEDMVSKEFRWKTKSNIDFQNPGNVHSFYYRLTANPNEVYFLPQVYRMGVNHQTGEPRMHINLYERESESGEKQYRIHMTFHIEPYFHPRAKKDLMKHLDGITNGKLKYVRELNLGGYQNVTFELNERFLSDNKVLFGEITEKAEQIDPSQGFTITADHSLESFDIFKDELLTNGIDIGKIYFELEEETEEGISTTKSNPITVELNFKKLENVPISVGLMGFNSELSKVPPGFQISNDTPIPLEVEQVELTLLSEAEDHLYDVDYELSTEGTDWPAMLNPGEKKSVLLNQVDVAALTDENMIWNELVCEPFGIRTKIDPEKIMASVIDHATGEPQMWSLDVSCPLYESWDFWTEEQREPYKHVMGVLVEIKTEDGETSSIELNKTNSRVAMKMARTVQKLLQGTNHENRKYEYRQTNVTLPPSQPGSWKSSENTSADHLMVYPEI